MRRLTKCIRLTQADRGLLIEAALALIYARLRLTVLPFKRAIQAPHSTPPSRNNPAEAASAATQVAWAIELAARQMPFHARCLPQAMAGQRMLLRRGIHSTLCIGLARDSCKGVASHAWVRVGPRIALGGPDTHHFALVTESPSREIFPESEHPPS